MLFYPVLHFMNDLIALDLLLADAQKNKAERSDLVKYVCLIRAIARAIQADGTKGASTESERA